ncbi:hypothetical protein PVAP13_3NG238101 [Panicum virgatum]|uniref:Uncharacterized protein n=1 Tax=Panicum virgatum TaxID=38727 RepID=A0A8T0U9Q6_PANVG|nr:hypothetical protein PVAP13_3NG238101 [Panicum virgatum]
MLPANVQGRLRPLSATAHQVLDQMSGRQIFHLELLSWPSYHLLHTKPHCILCFSIPSSLSNIVKYQSHLVTMTTTSTRLV